MKKLLVVGGTGFIGYHVIAEAKNRGWKVTSLSLGKPKSKRYHKKIKYIQVDFKDYKKLNKKIKNNFDYIVNAGGYGKHPAFDRSGKILFNSHYQGLLNLVKILSKKRIKKFVQIGSSAEYGSAISPQKENSKCFPKTPYALAKFSCTNFLINFSQINNFPSTILRFFQVYGPKQDKNRILPQLIENCLEDRSFSVTKGQQMCDFCFIDDVVKAIFKTLTSKKSNGEIINIGFGKPIKIKNVIDKVHQIIKKGQPLYGKLNYKKNTNMKLYPDVTKAKKLLNWQPKIKFSKGLRLTIKSYTK